MNLSFLKMTCQVLKIMPDSKIVNLVFFMIDFWVLSLYFRLFLPQPQKIRNFLF